MSPEQLEAIEQFRAQRREAARVRAQMDEIARGNYALSLVLEEILRAYPADARLPGLDDEPALVTGSY